MASKRSIITIDGPSGVGKSTVSRRVASALGFTYLDTGAMYRGVGLYFHRRGISPEDEKTISPLLCDIDLKLLPAVNADDDVGVLLNGEDVSGFIRSPEMSMVASSISALSSVRGLLTEMQRRIAASGEIVAEGRDMGTVVFPDAAYKFFLDAVPEERCRRRVEQLRQKGVEANREEILDMILQRDKNDSERVVAPLKKADDARLINTTALSVDQVCDQILGIIKSSSL